jgi:hypothetical protein
MGDASPYLEKPWSVVVNDGRVSICTPRAVIIEVSLGQIAGVTPYLPKLADRLAVAQTITRAVNGTAD